MPLEISQVINLEIFKKVFLGILFHNSFGILLRSSFGFLLFELLRSFRWKLRNFNLSSLKEYSEELRLSKKIAKEIWKGNCRSSFQKNSWRDYQIKPQIISRKKSWHISRAIAGYISIKSTLEVSKGTAKRITLRIAKKMPEEIMKAFKKFAESNPKINWRNTFQVSCQRNFYKNLRKFSQRDCFLRNSRINAKEASEEIPKLRKDILDDFPKVM